MPLPRSGPSWIMSHSQTPLPVPQPLLPLPFSALPQNPPLSTEEGLCILSPLRHLPKAPSSWTAMNSPRKYLTPQAKAAEAQALCQNHISQERRVFALKLSEQSRSDLSNLG